jgi:hypothetical protein
MATSKKVTDRIISQLKKYQAILSEAKDRDISESDTVVIIGDMLADILGYRKYIEITTEYAIRGTYVDLAVKVGEDIRFFIEAKAIGVNLKDSHIKQAIDYGANKGIEWVILTNGILWQIYRIQFRQPVDKILVYELDMLKANPKNNQVMECLSYLSREGFSQSSMSSFCQQQQITSRFSIAAILTGPAMIQALKKEIKRIIPSVKIEEDSIRSVLINDVLKREVVDSEDAKQASQYIKKSMKASEKNKAKDKAEPVKAPSCSSVNGASETNIVDS